MKDIFMPGFSHPTLPGKSVEWKKLPGDKISKREIVVVVEYDKAALNVESFDSGYLAAILVPAGEEVPVGSAIALIAETESELREYQHSTQS